VPALRHALAIVEMDKVEPAKSQRLLALRGGGRQEAGTDERGVAIASHSEQMHGAEVGNQPEMLFAQLQLRHGFLQGGGAVRHLLLHRCQRLLEARLGNAATSQFERKQQRRHEQNGENDHNTHNVQPTYLHTVFPGLSRSHEICGDADSQPVQSGAETQPRRRAYGLLCLWW
jgi:hypothetical protein